MGRCLFTWGLFGVCMQPFVDVGNVILYLEGCCSVYKCQRVWERCVLFVVSCIFLQLWVRVFLWVCFVGFFFRTGVIFNPIYLSQL